MKALKTVSKWIAGAALAGALFFAAPQKSEAQVAVGVQFGGPVYARPVPRPYYRPYYQPYYRPYYSGYYRPYPVYARPYPRPYPRPYYAPRPGVSFGVRIR